MPKAEPNKEPNITRINTSKGGVEFLVQIRSRAGGSLTKTFSDLKRAKLWRDRQKVVIEQMGFPMPQRGGLAVANVIAARLGVQTELGRSARQVLNGIQACEFGAISLQALTKTEVYQGVSRLFELGWSAAFVAKVSGHQTSAMLDRYEQVETPGDKFAGWSWSPWAIAAISA